jgi:hypothetical protein
MQGGVADDGEAAGTDGDSDGGQNRCLPPQHRRGLQLAIDKLWCELERGSESRRSRRRRGASLVWSLRRRNDSIYRNAR